MPNVSRLVVARAIAIRVALTLMAALMLAVPAITSAQGANVPRAYAGIVVDAKTGQVLYEDHADNLRYPASVTKVMTLYILFQELEAGRLSLDSRLAVSEHASQAVPTKLYVPAGSTIAVEDAIKSLVTLSANDVARVIGENISGSESAFAARMTRTARALGMSHTTYKNASGLPDSGQTTTVRDQAILARAVYLHYPRYYEYFQTRSFSYGKGTYGNHNALLGRNGVDGIKTGYIRAGGYNLMTAARKDDRHIVVIGFGFNTSGARNAKVAELVQTYLPKARAGGYWREAMISRPGLLGSGTRIAAWEPTPLGALPPMRPSAPMPLPSAMEEPTMQVASVDPLERPEDLGPQSVPFEVRDTADLDGDTALQQANYIAGAGTSQPTSADDPLGAWISETLKLGPTNADIGSLQPGQVLSPPDPVARPFGLTLDPVTTQASNAVGVSGWVIQVGAANDETAANTLISDATGAVAPLSNLRSFVERIERNGQVYYRARFAGFASRDQARATCNALSESSINCLAIQG